MKVDPNSDAGQRILRAGRAVTTPDTDVSIDVEDGLAYVWLWDPSRIRATVLQVPQAEL